MTKSDFLKTSVAYPLKTGEFNRLEPRIVKKLTRLMARISEASYRRGFQHGAAIKHGLSGADICKYRFVPSLDKSPWCDAPIADKSLDRLFTEYGVLRTLGIRHFEIETPKRFDPIRQTCQPTAELMEGPNRHKQERKSK